MARRAFDMMCERAVSRETRIGPLASMQMTQEKIADSWIEIEQFRLLVLRTAWLIDKHNDYKRVRKDIAAVKVAMPKVLHDVVQRAMHLHGALGVSNEMPFVGMMMAAESSASPTGPPRCTRSRSPASSSRATRPSTACSRPPTSPPAARPPRAHLADRLEHEIAEL